MFNLVYLPEFTLRSKSPISIIQISPGCYKNSKQLSYIVTVALLGSKVCFLFLLAMPETLVSNARGNNLPSEPKKLAVFQAQNRI